VEEVESTCAEDLEESDASRARGMEWKKAEVGWILWEAEDLRRSVERGGLSGLSPGGL